MAQDLIFEIENKFQFVITLAIFFGGFIVAAFDFWGIKDFEILRVAWQWYGVVFINLMSYIFFQIIQKDLSLKVLTYLRILIIITIGFFIGPIGFILSVGSNINSWEVALNKAMLFISLWGLPLVSLFVFLLLFVRFVAQYPFKRN